MTEADSHNPAPSKLLFVTLFVIWLALVVAGYLAFWGMVALDNGPGGGIMGYLAFMLFELSAGAVALVLLVITVRSWHRGDPAHWAMVLGLVPPGLYCIAMIASGS